MVENVFFFNPSRDVQENASCFRHVKLISDGESSGGLGAFYKE